MKKLGRSDVAGSANGIAWRPTEKATGYLALVALGVVAALVTGRPEAAVLASPFALAIAVGLARTSVLGLEARAAASAAVVTEGDEVLVRATFSSAGEVEGLEVLVAPAPGFVRAGPATAAEPLTASGAGSFSVKHGLGLSAGAQPPLSGFAGTGFAGNGVAGKGAAGAGVARADRPLAVRMRAGQGLELALPLRAGHWGRHPVGAVAFRARSLLGLFEASGWAPVDGTVLVYPRPEPLARLVGSRRAALPAGSHLSAAKGGGLDLAGVRAYAPGDRAKDVNWRASARHGLISATALTPGVRGRHSPAASVAAAPLGPMALYTNERHPERGADVVLVVDTFDKAVLHRAVTAACSLADAYLSQRDRLALLELGGGLRWLRPGMGPRQRQVVVDALLATTDLASAVYRGVTLLPPKLLPAAALVVGISSLEQAEAREAFSDMRARGLDVVVVEIPQLVAPLEEMRRLGRLAVRLWQLERGTRREELRAAGVPTVPWEPGQPLSQVIGELEAWARRQARSGS